MNEVLDILHLRRPKLDYVSPPFCELLFSATAQPIIVLSPIGKIRRPSGFILSGTGGLHLSWDNYPGFLCFSIYKLVEVDPEIFELVAECIGDNEFDLPGEGDYCVTVITPDGESECDVNDLIHVGPPAPPPPPPGDGCPAETGTDTPCDLGTPENTDLGNVAIGDITASPPISASFGSFPIGEYHVEYQNGCYSYDAICAPTSTPTTCYTTLGHEIDYITSSDMLLQVGSDRCDLDAGAGCASQAAGCSFVAGVDSGNFNHDGGAITLKFTGWGGYGGLTRHNGSPNPNWKLKRTVGYPTFPAQVRIQGYSAGSFSIAGDCNNADASIDPAWPGTFVLRTLSPPFLFSWRDAGNLSFKDKRMSNATVQWFQSHPTNSTGCGWRLRIILVNSLSQTFDAWTGFKAVGLSPVGRYYRNSGCSVGPECLVVEEF